MTLVHDPNSKKLRALAEYANAQHAAAFEAGRQAIEHAINVGTAMIEARSLVQKGHWHDWMEQNVEMNVSMVYNYIRIAEYADEVRAADVPTLRAARQMLVGKKSKESQRRDLVKLDAVRLYKQGGRSQAEVAEIFGVCQTTLWRWINPQKAEKYDRRKRRRTMAERRALKRQEQHRRVVEAGGDISQAYSLVRRALQSLEDLQPKTEVGRKRRNEAMHRLYNAEELISVIAKHEVEAVKENAA